MKKNEVDSLLRLHRDYRVAHDSIKKALEMIWQYGGIDGGHHKQWVLDQVVRILTLTPEEYEEWVRNFEKGEDGPNTYDWDKGIAP